MLVYVDDMLLITTCKKLLEKVKAELASTYKIQDLGPAKYFLGVQIRRGSGDITLRQLGYIRDIIEKNGMQDCKSAIILMDPGQHLMLTEQVNSSETESKIMQNIPYRKVIGQVLYLSTRTRPDIAATVGVLSRHASDPRPVHWMALKRILRDT
jgi:Reverse transcriptase (RNA-dependent DNA polymerase)